MDLNLTKDRIKELFAVKKNRRAVLIVWLVFLAILAFLAFKPKTNFKQLSLEPLQDLPSSYKLEGQDLYSFNGLGFTKTNISTGEQEVLSSGYRLPRINNIVWAGDEGALLSFEGSFYYTKVQDELKTVGLNIDEITKKFTWYLNFKDGSLKKVEDVRARKNLGYYDPNNKKLVFLPNESERVESAGNFYSLEILDIPFTGPAT